MWFLALRGAVRLDTAFDSMAQRAPPCGWQAAKRTNGWIVTGGTHAGVMKLVGQMLHESDSKGGPSKKDTVVLGVATMGSVCERNPKL